MRTRSQSAGPRPALLGIVVGALALLSGCIHVPHRAIDNGRAMSNSLAYRQFMAGDRNPATLKKLYYRADARLTHHREVPFPLFGNW